MKIPSLKKSILNFLRNINKVINIVYICKENTVLKSFWDSLLLESGLSLEILHILLFTWCYELI